ncbi:coat protein [Lake Sarah-associated circular virus-10]|uniref:Coat protein n=1 Tax=Lake Sarah-associated circular virus-10 TaxID=1685736 RepID=A0A126G9C8_9VIRU|nr:coat protein [Lake Sarah-associated circular virus-10]ALE29607.1 coat protein [Lake Sarah-associated circular virus-10]
MAKFVKKPYRKVRKYAKKPVKKMMKTSKSFVKKVQKIIHKDVETKVVVFNSNATAFNQQINSTGDCLRLLPDIVNGTSENTKIGNIIQLQSLNIRGVLTFALSQTASQNVRIGVRMLILRAKRFNDWNQSATDFATNYTKLLEGSTSGFDGSVAAFNTPVNHDYFSVVADKRFYMSQSVILASGPTINTNETTKFINFSVPYSRRKLTYDQDFSGLAPTNYPYFMVLGYSKLDGSVADGTGTTYLTFQYTATAKFEDA